LTTIHASRASIRNIVITEFELQGLQSFYGDQSVLKSWDFGDFGCLVEPDNVGMEDKLEIL
jgi:hypothetical protein